MSDLKRLLRDPLIHFLIGGALIFLISGWINGYTGSSDMQQIRVDRPALLKYLQYQSAAFKPDYFEAQLNAMTPQERNALIERYVQEEAMVREARAMGLDQVDYVIRQRLMQKMLFLIDDSANVRRNPSEAELRHYYERHKDSYRDAPTLTFTHVFVDNEIVHPEDGERTAQILKAELEHRHAGFDDAPAYGDRFPFLQNYINRPADFIANQLGDGFTRAIAPLQPSPHWQGPIRSSYGWHLLLITGRTAASQAPFEAVREQVKDDLMAERIARFRESAIKDLAKHYDVKVMEPEAPSATAAGKP